MSTPKNDDWIVEGVTMDTGEFIPDSTSTPLEDLAKKYTKSRSGGGLVAVWDKAELQPLMDDIAAYADKVANERVKAFAQTLKSNIPKDDWFPAAMVRQYQVIDNTIAELEATK